MLYEFFVHGSFHKSRLFFYTFILLLLFIIILSLQITECIHLDEMEHCDREKYIRCADILSFLIHSVLIV